MTIYDSIHQRAVRLSRNYRLCESELLATIQQVHAKQVFSRFGYRTLFDYCTKCLLLSEGTTHAMIRVALKAVEIPEIQKELKSGAFTLSHAKTFISVITPENKNQWLDKARSLSVRELERQVANQFPDQAIPEKIKPVCENKLKLECGISPELETKIRKAQDLLCQKTGKPVNLSETLAAVFEEFLQEHDPVNHTSRVSTWTKDPKAINRSRKIAVLKRDNGQCRAINPDGNRCNQRRWVDVHHIQLESKGGSHELDNLITLCKAHHRMEHAEKES